MANCPPRSVLNAGDRPSRIRAAAEMVQQAANALTQRVLPHLGSPFGQDSARGARDMGVRPGGMPIKHGSLGAGTNPMVNAMQGLGRAVDAFAREVSDTIDAQAGAENMDFYAARVVMRVHIGAYTEPMPLPDCGFPPVCVLAGRVVNMAAPDVPVLTGALVHWTPGAYNATTCRSIDGMTTGDGLTYAITFIYFGLG